MQASMQVWSFWPSMDNSFDEGIRVREPFCQGLRYSCAILMPDRAVSFPKAVRAVVVAILLKTWGSPGMARPSRHSARAAGTRVGSTSPEPGDATRAILRAFHGKRSKTAGATPTGATPGRCRVRGDERGMEFLPQWHTGGCGPSPASARSSRPWDRPHRSRDVARPRYRGGWRIQQGRTRGCPGFLKGLVRDSTDKRTAEILRVELEAAGVPYETPEG
jgi:hypothetical protein